MINPKLTGRVEQLVTERRPFVTATVVRAQRPTSARPGDAAVVLADGTIDGFVGGVCATSSVRLHSLRAMETGEPLLLRLVPDAQAGDAGELVDGAVVEHNPCLSGGSLEIFLEPHLPAPRLLIIGDSPIAHALERVGRAAGYDSLVAGTANAGELQDAAAVIVASHGNSEESVLAAALSAGVPYVALVASPKRGAAVRSELEVDEQLVAQLHTPAGLDIGARSPGEIAISILAELIAHQHSDPTDGRPAGEASAPLASKVVVAVDPVCGMQVAVTDATPSCASEMSPSSSAAMNAVRTMPTSTLTTLPPTEPGRPVTGLVLAAGGSKRLGQPKQLLPYGPGPLLAHVLGTARACGFAQLLCVLGGGADRVSDEIEFAGVEVVRNPHFGEGCSSSIAAALEAGVSALATRSKHGGLRPHLIARNAARLQDRAAMLDRFAEALAEDGSVAGAAAMIGVHPDTAKGYLRSIRAALGWQAQ